MVSFISKGCSAAEASTNGHTCAQFCGVCLMVNGPLGSGVWIINEIADVPAVVSNLVLLLCTNSQRDKMAVVLTFTWIIVSVIKSALEEASRKIFNSNLYLALLQVRRTSTFSHKNRIHLHLRVG